MPFDLTTRLTAYLNLAPEQAGSARGDLFAALSAAVVGQAERYTSRTLDVRTYTGEAYDGNGRDVLFLRHDPVVRLSAVSVNGEALTIESTPVYPPTAQVAIHRGDGAIVRLDGGSFPEGRRNVIVTYAAGLGEVEDGGPPSDLMQALVEWAGLLFRDRDRLGLASLAQSQTTTAYVRSIPPFVSRVLDNWRRGYVPSPS